MWFEIIHDIKKKNIQKSLKQLSSFEPLIEHVISQVFLCDMIQEMVCVSGWIFLDMIRLQHKKPKLQPLIKRLDKRGPW